MKNTKNSRQRVAVTTHTWSTVKSGKKTVLIKNRFIQSVRSLIDRSQRNYKYKQAPNPPSKVTLLPEHTVKPAFRNTWVSVRSGVTHAVAKAFRRKNQGRNSNPTLQHVLHVLGYARPTTPTHHLSRAAQIRQAVVDKVTAACGGFTGTVVARHGTDVKQALSSSDDHEQNKGQHKEHLTHLNMKQTHLVVEFKHHAFKPGGKWFVGITSGMKDTPCNLNIPNNNFTGAYGAQLKNEAVNHHGVNAMFGNPANKVGMPTGFRVGQMRPTTSGTFKSAIQLFENGELLRTLRYKRYPTQSMEVCSFPNTTAVQLFLDTLNLGQSDRATSSSDRVPDGECRQIREDVRNSFMNGLSKDYTSHGMQIIQHGLASLNALLEESGVKDTRTGEDTRRHFFVVAGHLAEEDHPYMLTKGEGQQLRVYCDRLLVYHIDPDAINEEGLFGPTLEELIPGQPLKSFIPEAAAENKAAFTPTTEEVIEKPVVVASTAKIIRRDRVEQRAAAAVAEEPTEVVSSTKIIRRDKATPVQQEEPTQVASKAKIVRRDRSEPSTPVNNTEEPTEVASSKKIIRRDLSPVMGSISETSESVKEILIPNSKPVQSDNLKAYYKASSLKSTRKPSERALTPEQVVNHFDVVNYPELVQKAKAILRLPTPQAGVRGVSATKMVANAVRLYLISHLTDGTLQGELFSLNFSEYPWSTKNIEDIVEIMDSLGVKNGLKDMPYITKEDETMILHFGEEVGFKILDGFVYDKRGRMISNMIELVVEERVIKGKNVASLKNVQFVSSIGGLIRLIYFGYLPLLVQSFTDTISSLSANFYAFCNDEFVNAKVDGTGLVKFTSDRVENQNGGALHRIKSNYSVLVYAKCTPFAGTDWKTWSAEESGGRFAKVLSDFYQGQTRDFDIREFWPTVIEHAIENYNLDYVFTKKSFVSGSLSHISLKLLKEHTPELFNKIIKKYGLENAEQVISLTLKPQKGFKRIGLSLAQSAPVENASSAGWKLYNQEYLVEGSLQPVAFLPTLSMVPGESLWIGEESELPVGLLEKVSRCFKIGVQPDTKPTFGIGCVLQEGNYTEHKVEDVDGTWQELRPIKPVMIKHDPHLKGNPTIAEVKIDKITTFVNHESPYSGKLNYVRYRIRKNMQLSAAVYELDVIWSITTSENWPKVRSIAKAMLVGAKSECIKLPKGVDVNIIHTQDGTKADTLYAWLMVIGNTIKFNKGRPEIAELEAEAKRINTLIGEPDFDGLLIEVIHVVAGEYDKIQALFKSKFGKAVEVRLKDMNDTGRMLFEMHQSSAYELLPEDKYGPHCYVRKGEDPASSSTNITRFVLKGNDVTEVHQRCFGFVGLPGCPVYNVELFESSTVMEAVSQSCMFPAAVRSMRYTNNSGRDMSELSMSLINDMDENLFKLKAMLQFSVGGDFNAKHHINVVQRGEFYQLQPEDKKMLLDRIIPLNLKAKRSDPATAFKLVCEALSDCVFMFMVGNRKTSIYLPALRKFNQLGSSNENTETLSSVFYESALKPLVMNPQGVTRAVLSNVRGKLETMIRSKESRKLLKGRSKCTARRVGLPCIPTGETWVLYSERRDSLYAQLKSHAKKVGVSLDIHGTYVGYNGRDPMAAGWFSKLRIVSPQENEASFWKMGIHHFGVSPVALYIDGGDCDGDNHTFALIGGEELLDECMTYLRVLEIRSAAMGTSMLFSGSYAFDHYTRKSFEAATKAMDSNNYSAAIIPTKEYVRYNIGAHQVQNVAVGQGFKFCMIAENLIELAQTIKKVGFELPSPLKSFADHNAYRVILATAELYEIMLGGYSPAAEAFYRNCLHPAIKEGKPFSSYLQSEKDHEELRKIIKEYGGSVECYQEILQVLDVVVITQQIELTGNLPANFANDVLLGAVVCSALFSFEITRDKFGGFCGSLSTFRRNNLRSVGHKRAMDYAYVFIGNTLFDLHGFGQFKELVQKSHVMSSIRRVFRYLDSEIGATRPSDWPEYRKWPVEFLNSFISKEPEEEEKKEIEENPDTENVTVDAEVMPTEVPVRGEERWFEGLTKDQIRAFQAVMAGKNVMISGEAGTGKTFLTKRIWNYCEKEGWKVLVTGSTGVSVMNIEGHGTVNSAFGLGLGFNKQELSGEQVGRILTNARASELCRSNLCLEPKHKGLFVIVDEIGFLDTKLIALVSKIVRESGVKAQWLFVGDPGQCSPVDGEQFFKPFTLEYTNAEPKTYASFLQSGEFTCVILKEPVRQAKDLEFLHSLRQLRAGKQVDKVMIERYKHSMKTAPPDEAIHTFFNNEDVVKHNLAKTQELIDSGHQHRIYRAKIKRLNIRDEASYNRFLQTFYPIEAEMTLCVGMPVMIRKNIKDEGKQLIAANGTVGVVTKLHPEGVSIKLDNGDEIFVQEEILEGPRNREGKPLGSFKQLPLHPAFALTGHKLQGLTLNRPLVVHAYQRGRNGQRREVNCTGWLYVVCSRVVRSDLLYFDASDPNNLLHLMRSVVVDQEALEWIEEQAALQS